jgi:hypothetical protein
MHLFRRHMLMMLILAASATVAAAQESGSEVELLNSDWKYSGYSKISTTKSDRGQSNGDYKVGRTDAYGFKYLATGVFRNNSQKTVSALEWDFVFSDKVTGKELKRFNVKTRQEIKPGQTVALSKIFFLESDKSPQSLEKADRKLVIKNVEFGSSPKYPQ